MVRVVTINGHQLRVTIDGEVLAFPDYLDRVFENELFASGEDRFGPGWPRQDGKDRYTWEPTERSCLPP